MLGSDRSMVIDITADDKTKRGVSSARKGLNSLAVGVGVVGAAVGGLGLGAMVKSTLEAADATQKFADRLGITSKGLVGLRHAADLTGVGTAALDMGLQRMTRRVQEAAGGTGEAVKALKDLNISAVDLAKLSPDEQFKAIAGAMNNVESESEKVRLSFKLFDSEGVALKNTLALGAEGLNEVAAEADALGLAMDRADYAKIEAANDAITRMQGALQGAVNTLTVELAPILEVLADELTALSKNSDGFKDSIISFVDKGVYGVGLLSDAFYGWKLIFSGLNVAWKGLEAGLLNGMALVDRTFTGMINNDIRMVNKLIDGVNLLGAGIKHLELATVDATLAGMAADSMDELGKASDAFWGLASGPKPSEMLNAAYESLKVAADAKAEEIAMGAADSIVTGGGMVGPADADTAETDKNAKLKQEMADKLETLEETYLSEQELLFLDREAKRLIIEESRAMGIETDIAYNDTLLNIENEYMTKKDALIAKADKEQLKNKQKFWDKQAQYARNGANAMSIIQQTASALFDSGSKADFEKNKKVQMASTVVNTYAGAVSAMATYGGGPLGIAMAALTVAFGLAQLSKISSSSYDGGGGGGVSTPATPSLPFPEPQQVEVVEQPEPGGPEAAAVNYHIEVHGNIMDSDATARALIEPLEQARLDGVTSEL